MSYSQSKGDRKAFTDAYAKSKKWLPECTKYKYDVRKSLDMLSGSPNGFKVKRH